MRCLTRRQIVKRVYVHIEILCKDLYLNVPPSHTSITVWCEICRARFNNKVNLKYSHGLKYLRTTILHDSLKTYKRLDYTIFFFHHTPVKFKHKKHNVCSNVRRSICVGKHKGRELDRYTKWLKRQHNDQKRNR